ncbi:hypothetical protein N7475_003383 [Penicillium sp. IBT 31633x]|nr:hypothetical protein N7475_003383 [Penicillium sp. IBT 31633x]
MTQPDYKYPTLRHIHLISSRGGLSPNNVIARGLPFPWIDIGSLGRALIAFSDQRAFVPKYFPDMADYLVNKHPLQRMPSPSRGVSALVHVGTMVLPLPPSHSKIQN